MAFELPVRMVQVSQHNHTFLYVLLLIVLCGIIGYVIYNERQRQNETVDVYQPHTKIDERFVVSFRENPEKIEEIIHEVCMELNETYQEKFVLGESGEATLPFTFQGLTNLNADYRGYEYGVVALVRTEEVETVLYPLRKKIAVALHEKGVKMAEQQTYYQTRLNA